MPIRLIFAAATKLKSLAKRFVIISVGIKQMEIVETIETRKIIAKAKSAGKKIGFVPTMVLLHTIAPFFTYKGCKEPDRFVVASIFVNPTQFGPGEDLDKYPLPFDADIKACKNLNVDVVFAPSVQQMYPVKGRASNGMYPQKNLTWVNVEKLTEPLCGKSRPSHFRGVATVCAKLFNIIQPDVVFLGRKDRSRQLFCSNGCRFEYAS